MLTCRYVLHIKYRSVFMHKVFKQHMSLLQFLLKLLTAFVGILSKDGHSALKFTSGELLHIDMIFL